MQLSRRWERLCQPLPKPPKSLPTLLPRMSLPLPPAKLIHRLRLYPRSLTRSFWPRGNGTTAKTKSFKALSHQRLPGRTMTSPPSLHRQPLHSLRQAEHTSPQAPDQEPWLLPKPDTCLFNIFGESFQLQDIKERIAKGQMPHCLFKDPAEVDQQPLNRQEMWAAMQYKPIYRTAGRWTYWELLPDDVRKPPPLFCNEIEDAPKQPPASRLQPKEKARPKHVPPSARPSMPPKSPSKDSWADATEEEAASQPAPSSKPQPAQVPKATSATTDPTVPPKSNTEGQKPEPPPQQHLRPPETQSFLPKDSEPLPKPCPPSLLSLPRHPRDNLGLPTGQGRPRMTSRTYLGRFTCPSSDKIWTWMFFAA